MATKIQNLATTQLTLASHVQFHTEAAALIAEPTAEKLHLTTLYPLYQTAVGAESDVVNRPTAYAETQQMRDADHRRDLAVSLLFNLTGAFALSPLVTHTHAAATLAALISPYRGIQGHEMNRQTTEVDGLTAALAEPAAAAALEALDIEVTAELLAAANTGFKSATAARDTEALRRQPVKEADTKQLRAATDDLYRQLVEQTNAYAIIQPTEDLTAFITRMNVLVAKYKVVIANQGKTTKKTDDATKQG